MKIRAADKMFTIPWLITPEGFDAMLAIASEIEVDPVELAKALHGPLGLSGREGQQRADSTRMTMREGGVAVIPVDGPIFRYADMFVEMSGGVSTAALTRDFARALDDPMVSAIMFRYSSPGGEAEGIAELADMIYAARGRKPIGAYVEGYAASAAYWLASAADVIGADSTALLGSIGVLIRVDDPAATRRASIEFVSKHSPNKRPNPTTDHGRGVLQKLADDLGDVFVEAVAKHRGVSAATVLERFGAGGLLVGQHAVEAGMADYLTSEDAMIRDLAARARGEPTAAARPQAKERTMSGNENKGGFWAWMTGTAGDMPTTPAPAAPAAPAPAPAPAATEPADGQLADLRAELVRLRASAIEQQAQTFVREQQAAGRMLPAEAAAALDLYRRVAEIDATTIQAAGQPTLGELVGRAYSARPASLMARDLLTSTAPSAQVLPAAPAGEAEQLAEAEEYGRKYARQANGKGGSK